MSQHHRLVLLAAAAAALAGACTEPVDCQLEPGRCLQLRRAAPPVAAPSAVGASAATDRPSAAPTPAAARERVGLPEGAAAGQRFIDLGPGDPASAALRVARLQARGPQAPRAEPAAPTANDDVSRAVRAIRPAAAAHDFDQLAPALTPRLAQSLREALPQHATRFWRHIDRYVAAIDKGFQVQDEPGEGGARQLILQVEDGSELKPILTKTPDGWKFDRF